eukprot:TRINITY_DN71856_c0_g1_i1.p2 TRINITY_DN71856_c0_g1~~TRINITY_DN71856_c0_g1_i1.p2  ORF type:complete len:102 (-),score=0.76 TRINITY_DN71856_c0_g1_i1:69-374(-)
MAKFSIKAGQHDQEPPLVISDNPSITRILVSMGFDDIFRLVDKSEFDTGLSAAGDTIVIEPSPKAHSSKKRQKKIQAKSTQINGHTISLHERHKIKRKQQP